MRPKQVRRLDRRHKWAQISGIKVLHEGRYEETIWECRICHKLVRLAKFDDAELLNYLTKKFFLPILRKNVYPSRTPIVDSLLKKKNRAEIPNVDVVERKHEPLSEYVATITLEKNDPIIPYIERDVKRMHKEMHKIMKQKYWKAKK